MADRSISMDELVTARVVIEELARTLDIEQDRVTPETRLSQDLGADSLDMVELESRLSQRLNKSIRFDHGMPNRVSDIINIAKEEWL